MLSNLLRKMFSLHAWYLLCIKLILFINAAYNKTIFLIKACIQNVSVGKGLYCCGPCILRNSYSGTIEIGNTFNVISHNSRVTANSVSAPSRLVSYGGIISIGDNVGVNGVSITARSKTIRIGNHVMIGPNCVIVDSDFHQLDPDKRCGFEPVTDADVTIKDNVWLGMNVIILKGVTIGENSVIGAGSVVTTNIPSNVVAVGSPAKVVRSIHFNS